MGRGTSIAVLLAGLSLGGLLGCAREEPVEEALLTEAGGEVLAGVWADEETGVAVFKGVPFAAPPIGELRWRDPAEHEPRSGVQRAREFAPRCSQSPSSLLQAQAVVGDLGGNATQVPEISESGEDCLYLNVWTPNLSAETKRPVMVWIHGGSNIWGGGDEPQYDGTALARRGVVVVTFNYRLGLFGYLAHPALSAESEHGSSGNYGLLDQVAALDWVQRNIEAFGGDPDRVTLFGGSAGGADVLHLMTSPLAEGLFDRAIAQSGALPAEPRTLEGQELRGVRLEEIFELQDSDDVLRDLRAIPSERLLEVATDHLNEELDCAPVSDGWALPDLPGRVFASGGQQDIPLIIGSNANEWSSLGRYSELVSVGGFRGWLASHWGPLAERAQALYPAVSTEEVAASVARWQTDRWFTCPASFVARSMAGVSSPVYLYEFTGGSSNSALRAYHGAEVAYVFNNLAAESWVPREAADQELAEAVADYWVHFAATGDPNVEGRPEWPTFEERAQRYLEIGDEFIVKADLRARACALWETRLRAALDLGR